jgi:hypothetical protein
MLSKDANEVRIYEILSKFFGAVPLLAVWSQLNLSGSPLPLNKLGMALCPHRICRKI